MTTLVDAITPDYSFIVTSQSRRDILDAAINVIAENTFENVTMDRIATQAGVSRLKLYREFGNRSVLVEAVIAYRLMLFDERFFAAEDGDLSLPVLIERYLIASAETSRQNPVSRRWASGSMKFIHAGSLIHRTSVATWGPVIQRANTRGGRPTSFSAEEVALWLMTLQYSLGRLVVETAIDELAVQSIIRHFVVPAFLTGKPTREAAVDKL